MLSQRAKGLKPSATLALASKAKELKAEGKDVISLSVGEPDWDTFDFVKQAGIEAIQNGETKYTPANGIIELREAIAQQTNSDLNLHYSANQVTVSTGGKFVIFAALQMLLDPGDEVIIPAPYWVSYPTMTELAGGIPCVVPCGENSNFKLTPEVLKEALTTKTKVIILNSPSNPTGGMYSAEELKGLAEVLKHFPDVIILSDDIYNRLVFTESGLAPHILKVAPELANRTVIINGASKTYSMTGWRVGWAVGPQELISAMTKYQSQSVSCPTPFSQRAAVVAIKQGDKALKQCLSLLKKRKDFVVDGFANLPKIKLTSPEGAFYIWPKISAYFGKFYKDKKITNSREFSQALLEDQMVVVVPGIDFGLDGYLRVSYVINEQRMAQAIQRITTFLSHLN